MIRNTLVEVLRIFSMLFIVGGHFASQGGLNFYFNIDNNFIFNFMSNGQRVSINIFLLISSWFLVEQKSSFKRIVKVWIHVFFYTAPITILLFIFCGNVSMKELVQCFLPYVGRPLWFASAYISLLLLSPFLNKALQSKKDTIKKFLFSSFLIICFLPTFAKEMDTYICAVAWFCFIYMCVGYYKKYTVKCYTDHGFLLVLLGITLYVVMVYIHTYGYNPTIKNIAGRFLHDFKSLPNIITAFLIFIGIISMRNYNSECINVIASGAFSVYIVHQIPALYMELWKWMLNIMLSFKNISFNIMFCLSIICLYLFISIIDIPIRCCINKIIRSQNINNFIIKIDKLYNI